MVELRNLWRVETTLARRHGRAVLPRRHLADQQVSPAKLVFVPRLIETALGRLS